MEVDHRLLNRAQAEERQMRHGCWQVHKMLRKEACDVLREIS
ncbi:hypothetical protein M8C21_012996 [Ambrosia artemisiifolia]|uniref:Uncharacterized protein n=1 Tax=Ambrosia artemisiifolia TaxID=4212 RepID=A0AAD5CU73_AMBAR|nr:hypothetical protein M8C21_012996 [Ambrosia artemisiifolia]